MVRHHDKTTDQPPQGYRIEDMPIQERPRERLESNGAHVLSEAELLAILLRTGVTGESAIQIAQRLLRDLKGLYGIYQTPFMDLCRQHGIGKAKAAQLLAALELGHRLERNTRDVRPVITSPDTAARLVEHEMGSLQQEALWIILLDTRNRLISIEKLYQGTLYSANIRNAEIFRAAIAKNAASILIIHNHPSGDPAPSAEDILFTRNAIEAGKQLEIEVHDHLIIGGIGRFTSLREKGLAFRV